MNISLAIMYMYPQANPLVDFSVQDDSDGEGPYIAKWDVKNANGVVLPEPTEAELQTAWDAYLAEETAKIPVETLEQKVERLGSEKEASEIENKRLNDVVIGQGQVQQELLELLISGGYI